MLFNSIDFALFLPIVFTLYWFCFNQSIQIQNLLLVVVSYLFYGWWDWKFLYLIFISTLLDFLLSYGMGFTKKDQARKILLWISIIINLGLLGFFKYYNFFIENFVAAFSFFGSEISVNSVEIILPVGISFYTFQTLSYTIDVYQNKIKPTKDFVAFAAYISFFPQLVAGPIERATNFLPQFLKSREFNYSSAVDGLRQILWGLFKKIVIADNCAEISDLVFNNSEEYHGLSLFIGASFFAIQIYCDFSGYSDIAIGTARLFGFNLMQNFAFPYFSRDVAEFWRRWHISLSTWFRDYLYIPLGGSNSGFIYIIRNTFIIFLVSGFWHGANWTYVFWGLLNAIFFLPLLIFKKNRSNIDIVAKGKNIPELKDVIKIVITFILITLTWIFFRSESLSSAFLFLQNLVLGLFKMDGYIQAINILFYDISLNLILLLGFFIIVEWLGREGLYALQNFGLKWKKSIRYLFYFLLMLAIIRYAGKESAFIYFQF